MRVSKKMLENKVDQLNKITNSPTEYYRTEYSPGNIFKVRHTNKDHFCISGAYGGYELQRVCNDGGGVRTFFNTGHIPKKELYNLISAFIDGIELQKNHMNELLNEWKIIK
tara:strand:- start:600 stop:932 length:333 start_codon:yes stop_codon:yes gene_type:complete